MRNNQRKFSVFHEVKNYESEILSKKNLQTLQNRPEKRTSLCYL